ncbi:MAG TPA: ferredoxin reductase [Candidatus Dormibacteraeota bacterium]|nr:ferredoxin reductase [Candidatus Dormibacteraeota bacterium]
MQPVLEWQAGTLTAIRPETKQTKSFTLTLPKWMVHRPGQHYDVRLTAPDGYRTERSYSIASPPERVGELELTVERIAEGEVSPYLHDVLVPGDQLEVRGPIGGYFVWDVALGGPLLLIGGGSGVVPLMAMLRHRAAQHATLPARLLYSSRSVDDVIYRDELDGLARSDRAFEVFYTFTRQPPVGWTGYRRRVDAAMLGEVIKPFDKRARVYICGPTLLVEGVANALVQMQLPIEHIRTERFGPTGA